MAEALIAATVKVLLEKAVSLAVDRIGLVLGSDKDLKALQEYAVDIQAVLADAEAKQSENPIILRWLQKVEAAAFDATNVLDELVYESVRRQVKSRGSSKVCLFFTLSKHDISFRWRMGSKVRDINEKLKRFNGEIPNMGLIRMADSLIPTVEVRKRQTDSLPLLNFAGREEEESGREKEESQIVEMLLSGASDRRVSVLPIVGMGGLGKTTLAKLVYNHKNVEGFNKKCWICVSDTFDVTEMFRGILESLKKGKKVEASGRNAIVQQIQRELEGERFLIVLDDVWNEDTKLWDDFFSSLVALSSANGSWCILTTRLQTTANLVSTHGPFMLGKLSDEACWFILTQRATKGGDFSDELKACKSHILRRCHGLPLAATVIGGLLSLQRKEEWLSILENKVLKVGEDVGGEIMPILRLSFDYLPSSSIKKCFAYCSIYAKDMKMIGEVLVQLWLAEGFIQEDVVGRNYLAVLLLSSLLEKGTDENGGEYYKMHDLVHDLGESVSNRKQSNLVNSYQARHLALSSVVRSSEKSWNEKSPLVQIVKDNISVEMLLKYKYLYILDLSGSKIMSLAQSVSKLKHLRYLVLSHDDIKILPDCLCELYNLQTLRLDYCGNLRYLPRGLNSLINLRHLHFITGDYGARMPPKMGFLTQLQTLKYFNVMEENGHGIEELRFMKFLEGCLEIRNLEFVKGKDVAKLANLVEKKNLLQLKLMWSHNACHDIDSCDDVLEGLKPHSNLLELGIWSFGGVRFPQWFGKLSALVNLRFGYNKNVSELPTLGHLPFLEILEILYLTNVGCIGHSFYTDEGSRLEGKVFPALKRLVLTGMENLSEWKELNTARNGSLVVYPKLVHLVIHKCSRLAITPTRFPSLARLVVKGDLKVSVVRDIVGSNADSMKSLKLRSISGLSNLADVIVNHLTVLEELEISDCDGLVDIPSSTLECCEFLESFTVLSCSNLVSCPLNSQQTPCLSKICIKLCPSLFTTNAIMPGGFSHFTKLKDLSVGPFSDDAIHLFDWSGLRLGCSSTLQRLDVDGSGILPQQLQHLTSVESLLLDGFGSVEALPEWFGNFASLRLLILSGFSKLQHLASAQAMARMTSIERLFTDRCPLFKENWCRKTSFEWFEIFGRSNVHVEMS